MENYNYKLMYPFYVSSMAVRQAEQSPEAIAERSSIIRQIGTNGYEYIKKYYKYDPKVEVTATNNVFNISKLKPESYRTIINLDRLNDVPNLNEFVREVNRKLQTNGKFIGKIETKDLRKKRLMAKYVKPLNIIYYVFDFIFKRVFPKFKFTNKIYMRLTGGRNHVITKTEILGRLAYNNFEIISEKEIGSYLFFTAKKTKNAVEKPDPSYGFIIRLKRVGKDGRVFNVFKLRTMHPYAEYIQNYVYETNNLDVGGKFKNDYRISTLGQKLRKYWIDELPMIFNLLRREMKLVGVRPLSRHYFSLYTKELQEKRTRVKPGLFPPFYADMPQSLEEIIQSELRYLAEYEKAPLTTDFKYLMRGLANIVFRAKHSK